MQLTNIDVIYDVRIDSKGKDPDSHSRILKEYHRLLWSKQLTKGDVMKLDIDKNTLRWGDFWFGCDSLLPVFYIGVSH